MNKRMIICLVPLAILLAAPSSAIEFKKVEPTQPMQPIEKSGDAPMKKMQKTAPAPPVRTAQPSLVLTEPRGGYYMLGESSRISWTARNIPGNVDIGIRHISSGKSWAVAKGVPAGKGSIPWRNGRHMNGYVKVGSRNKYRVFVNVIPFTGVEAKSDELIYNGDYEVKGLIFEPATRQLTAEVHFSHGGMLSPFLENRAYGFLQYACENSSQPIVWNEIWPSTPATLDTMEPRLIHTFIVPATWRGDCTMVVDPERFVLEDTESNNAKTITLR